MSGTTISPASAFSSTTFSDAEKADVRRFCGYPPYGGGTNAGFQSWRFMQAYGLLEFRMNNLAPAEYQNVRYRLSLLYPIEAAIAAAYETLNTQVAAAFKRNPNELADRDRQYSGARLQFCNVVGIPPGPDLSSPGTLRMVV